MLNITWFIFSDGEEDTRKAVLNAINLGRDEGNKISLEQLESQHNIVFQGNNNNYETQLFEDGYQDVIIASINQVEKKHNQAAEDEAFFHKAIESTRKNHKDLSEKELEKKTLKKLCSGEGKARYAYHVAKSIVSLPDEERRFPPKIRQLMNSIKTILNLSTER